jgi:hypothetical protein
MLLLALQFNNSSGARRGICANTTTGTHGSSAADVRLPLGSWAGGTAAALKRSYPRASSRLRLVRQHLLGTRK